MICHLCQQLAIGQCKECYRFYCATHGDRLCVRCVSAIQEKPQPEMQVGSEAQTNGREDDKETTNQFRLHWAVCFHCQKAASGACIRCGKLHCGDHGGLGSLLHEEGLCLPCQKEARIGSLTQLVLFALILLGFLVYALL